MRLDLTTDIIAGLLPEFRCCETYADRIAFWTKHQLIEHLYYDAVESAGLYYPANFINARLKCRTWQDAKQLPILTLAPFDTDQVWQFISWALQVRPGMNPDVQSFESLKSDFLDQYSRIERNREHWLTQRREAASRWADNKAIPGHAQRRTLLDIFGVDADLFADISHALNEAAPIDLVRYIRIGRVDQNWTVVDTYLFARAKYDFAVFLENFDPASYKPQPVNNEPGSKRRRILMHFYEDGKMIERKHKDYNDYIPYATDRKRLAYANGSQSKLRPLIDDIEAIRNLLSEKAKQRADKELIILKGQLIVEK